MPNYVISNSTAVAGTPPLATTTTYKTQLAVAASTGTLNPPNAPSAATLRRGRIYDILIGASSAADFAYEWNLSRITNVGSSAVWLGSLSSLSSQSALDLADNGYQSFGLNNSSAETNITTTTEVWYVGVNQRASYRWVAAPGSEFVWPATASAGFALQARSAQGGVSAMTGAILFSE